MPGAWDGTEERQAIFRLLAFFFRGSIRLQAFFRASIRLLARFRPSFRLLAFFLFRPSIRLLAFFFDRLFDYWPFFRLGIGIFMVFCDSSAWPGLKAGGADFLPLLISGLPWPFGAFSMADSDSSRNLRSGEVRFVKFCCHFVEIGHLSVGLTKFRVSFGVALDFHDLSDFVAVWALGSS